MKRWTLLPLAAVVLLAALAAPFAAAPEHAASPAIAAAAASPQSDVARELDVMIPMRDGVRLATDIYRPANAGVPTADPLPALLQRTPYDKRAAGLVQQAEFFARHGYVVAIQNIRGRYRSEGVFSKYDPLDAPDGFDTIAALAKLPYVNGQVGTWGTSYAAHTQADAAKLAPPALKTMVLNMGGMSNAWDHSVRHDGAFELGRQLTWAWEQILAQTDDPVVRAHLETEKVQAWYTALPFRKGLNPLAIAPNFEAYFLDEATRADYDSHWQNMGLDWIHYYPQTSDVPMLHLTGWFDVYTRGTIENYLALAKLKKSAVRLVIGPWTHSGNARTYAGDVDFGADAAIRDFGTAFHLRWFDHFLKGLDTGVERDAPVRIFVMGTGDGGKDARGRLRHGGFWYDAPAWPLPATSFTKYYLHGDGRLLTTPPAAASAPTVFTFDPANPVPTIGGGVSARLKDGAYDQREREDFFPSKPPYLPLRSRRDIVVFETDPLPTDVTVVGPITVRLFASSTAVDTDFTAKLVDVYPLSREFPTGFDMNITDGIIRARYRGGRLKGELMRPGEVYEFEIRPFPTANVFKKGHRIRVDISSSNFPMYDVNPNTGEPLGANRRMIRADNSIYHDAAHASHIVLPIVQVRRPGTGAALESGPEHAPVPARTNQERR
jgi:putative CocE/NonD family hydrolase